MQSTSQSLPGRERCGPIRGQSSPALSILMDMTALLRPVPNPHLAKNLRPKVIQQGGL